MKCFVYPILFNCLMLGSGCENIALIRPKSGDDESNKKLDRASLELDESNKKLIQASSELDESNKKLAVLSLDLEEKIIILNSEKEENLKLKALSEEQYQQLKKKDVTLEQMQTDRGSLEREKVDLISENSQIKMAKELVLKKHEKLSDAFEKVRPIYEGIPCKETINPQVFLPVGYIGVTQMGRFGNNLFQFAFAHIFAYEHNLAVEFGYWKGYELFSSIAMPIRDRPFVYAESVIDVEKKYPSNNISGYFQFHSSFYRKHQQCFRDLFRPKPDIKEKIEIYAANLRARGNTVVAFHIRRTDFGDYASKTEWYLSWLRSNWGALDKPVLFIATDDTSVLLDFASYNPVAAADLGKPFQAADFYVDFYILSQADIVAVSKNSTFSFAATMLNEHGHLFLIPEFIKDIPSEKLIPYDPWDFYIFGTWW